MIQPRIDLQAWLQENAAVPQQALPVDSLHPAELSTDSRQLQPGSVFLPLIGDSFDGHRFLQQAFAQGARLAFCAESYFQAHQAELADLALIRVADTLAAYQSLARSWRRLMGIPVIAVTGSSGKTSTKEILFQVLSPFFRVHRSQANYNNQVGVPKTLLELRPEHALCLVEMGMRGLGQIHELCSVAEPDYGIITNIGPVHLSELGTMENVARAKWELADWLQAHAGLLAINADNSWLHDLGLSYPGRLVRCGRGADDDLQMLESTAAAGSQRIRYRIGEQPARSLTIDLEGEHQALNLLCCLGILHSLDKTLPDGQELSVPRLFGRQQRLELAQGLVLINDAYNANPDSMKAALSVLAGQPGRRIAVLGKMAELGPQADTYHRALGAVCEDLHLDAVYVVGPEARPVCESLKQVPGFYFERKEDLIAALEAGLGPGDSVLFKASRSACLEEVVEPVTQYFTQLV